MFDKGGKANIILGLSRTAMQFITRYDLRLNSRSKVKLTGIVDCGIDAFHRRAHSGR